MATLFSRDDWLKIHYALHDKTVETVYIHSRFHAITIGRNGCRYIRHKDRTFMQQNPNKSSAYATRARNGEKITWVMRNDNGPWGLITGNLVERYHSF